MSKFYRVTLEFETVVEVYDDQTPQDAIDSARKHLKLDWKGHDSEISADVEIISDKQAMEEAERG